MSLWHMENGAVSEAGGSAPSGGDPPDAPAPPVLIAHGEEDVVIPAANVEPLAARWPGARVELFAAAGHAFMAQEPERLAALLAGFFDA